MWKSGPKAFNIMRKMPFLKLEKLSFYEYDNLNSNRLYTNRDLTCHPSPKQSPKTSTCNKRPPIPSSLLPHPKILDSTNPTTKPQISDIKLNNKMAGHIDISEIKRAMGVK